MGQLFVSSLILVSPNFDPHGWSFLAKLSPSKRYREQLWECCVVFTAIEDNFLDAHILVWGSIDHIPLFAPFRWKERFSTILVQNSLRVWSVDFNVFKPSKLCLSYDWNTFGNLKNWLFWGPLWPRIQVCVWSGNLLVFTGSLPCDNNFWIREFLRFLGAVLDRKSSFWSQSWHLGWIKLRW